LSAGFARMHSVVQRFRQLSFHAGTWWTLLHTTRWHASVHESSRLTPHTVTHVFGVTSFASPPILQAREGATRHHGERASRHRSAGRTGFGSRETEGRAKPVLTRVGGGRGAGED